MNARLELIDLNEIFDHVDQKLAEYYARRVQHIAQLQVSDLIDGNVYLWPTKKSTLVSEVVEQALDTISSSSEEAEYGDFLRELAMFVAVKFAGGWKSSSPGLDLEFIRDGIHYVISIKSSTNWGNSSQQEKLAQDFGKALVRLRQGKVNAEAVLGMCYGKTHTSRHPKYGYLKLAGQNFWTFISGDKELYRTIIEPVGYRAKEHNEAYIQQRDSLINLLTKQFIDRFCDDTGAIDWQRVVEANSGNYDLDKLGLALP